MHCLTGTYAGLVEKNPYLKLLGINCIELMPIIAFDEFEYSGESARQAFLNYRGYSTIGFFAPKAGYAASGRFDMETDELKHMIRQLHMNRIEVIPDVVFNHTAEGGETGPYVSYRGFESYTLSARSTAVLLAR